MHQLSLLGEVQPVQKAEPKNRSKIQPNKSKSAPKQVVLPVVQQVAVQPEQTLLNPTPAPYGHCRICGSWIAIPGLDASLCSHSACSSSGWRVDAAWVAANPQRGGKGGAA